MRRVEVLRERLAAGIGGDDIVPDRGNVGALAEPGREFFVERREAGIDLVQVDRIPFGRLDPAAYDRTVTILLTAAPEPLLKTAPRGAVSDAVLKTLGTLD